METLAKITDYGVTQSKTDKAMVFIDFSYKEGSCRWFGMLTEDRVESTFKALFHCGFSGLDPMELEAGMGSGVLTEDEQILVPLVDELDSLGNTVKRVRFSGVTRPVDPEKIKTVMTDEVLERVKRLREKTMAKAKPKSF